MVEINKDRESHAKNLLNIMTMTKIMTVMMGMVGNLTASSNVKKATESSVFKVITYPKPEFHTFDITLIILCSSTTINHFLLQYHNLYLSLFQNKHFSREQKLKVLPFSPKASCEWHFTLSID